MERVGIHVSLSPFHDHPDGSMVELHKVPPSRTIEQLAAAGDTSLPEGLGVGQLAFVCPKCDARFEVLVTTASGPE